MKNTIRLAALLLACLPAVAESAERSDPPDLTVTQPLTPLEKRCAAKLTHLRSARLWWNDDNRIVGVSLKGIDANNRALALTSHLPGLRSLVIVALPRNDLTNDGLAPLAAHSELRLLSISGDRLDDACLFHIQGISTLEVLVLNGNFTDTALNAISPLSNLRQLDLTQALITDTGLAQLAHLASLQTLILNGTHISNESLPSIVQLKRLTKLYLGDTTLDDGAVEQLKTLEQLELLFIKGTRITNEGLDRLVPALPATCKIIHDHKTCFGERVPQTAMVRSAVTPWRATAH